MVLLELLHAGNQRIHALLRTCVVDRSAETAHRTVTLDADHILLISGLANVQLIRTAEMADVAAVLLARGKKASPEMIEMADRAGLIILETPFSLFRASGVLYANGMCPVY